MAFWQVLGEEGLGGLCRDGGMERVVFLELVFRDQKSFPGSPVEGMAGWVEAGP